MRAINHDRHLLLLLHQDLLGLRNVLLFKVGALGAATEDHKAVLIPLGASDGRQTLLRHAHEVMLSRCRADSVNGDPQVAIGSILEAHREGEARGKLAMKLALGCAGANSTNRDEIGEELGRNGIKHLAGNRHARRGEITEEGPGDTETLVDLEGLVDIGIVDEALPADCGARLLEVGAHNDVKVTRKLASQSLEPVSILNGGGRVVNGARPDNNEQAIVATHDDIGGLHPPLDHRLQGILGHGDLRDEKSRRDQGILTGD